jgi:hypothetical protein
MKTSLLIVVMTLASFSIFAMDEEREDFSKTSLEQKQGSLYEICEDGVYSGWTQLNGNIVYLGIEKINTTIDKQNWLRYKNDAVAVATLYEYLRKSSLEGNEISLDSRVTNRSSVKDITGFASEDELQQYLISFRKFSQNEKALNIATNIAIGAYGFNGVVDVGCYVAYSSKQKVSGRYLFPQNFGSISPIAALEKYFKDLILIACSRNYYGSINRYITACENRGIFTNPLICFYDGIKFSGHSLKLHGFIALVRRLLFLKEDENKEYVYLSAAYGMTKALINFGCWRRNEFMLNYKDFVDCNEKEKEPGYGDTPCLVKIDALIRIYLD